MGVPVPDVKFQSAPDTKPDYGFANTSVELDQAFKQFHEVAGFLADLAAVLEGATFQIANDIKRTQRRVECVEPRSYPDVSQYG